MADSVLYRVTRWKKTKNGNGIILELGYKQEDGTWLNSKAYVPLYDSNADPVPDTVAQIKVAKGGKEYVVVRASKQDVYKPKDDAQPSSEDCPF